MIKVGDLVVVVRGCPKCNRHLGFVFTVQQIKPVRGYQDSGCGWHDEKLTVPAAMIDELSGIPVPWLKRIPPLEEIQLERLSHEEPTPAA